ncbi:MAG: hypothetical protein JWQ41_2767 [Variovorax sp.]|nr:hypothetical protein [Variovorax sp.]
MSSISAILLKNSPANTAPALPLDTQSKTFTRKPIHIAPAAIKDKAITPEAALVRQLDRMFPNAGVYSFTYEGAPCRLQRQLDNNILAIEGPGDRVVMIKDGAILDEHVLQGDMQAFMSAARSAQPV